MSWLKTNTNRDEEFWLARVQTLISEATTDRPDGHGDTDEKWVYYLVDEIISNLPPEGQYDGNMRIAATVSAVLGLWYSQVHNAKIHDPNRPSFVRQLAYYGRQGWIQSFIENLFDISRTATYFPGQKWESPWVASPKSGEFL